MIIGLVALAVVGGVTAYLLDSDGSHPFELLPTMFPINGYVGAADWLWSGVCTRFPRLRIAMSEGGLGWVTCTENILSEARGNISVTSVLATNIFERSGGEWMMVHHHASHILTGDASSQS